MNLKRFTDFRAVYFPYCLEKIREDQWEKLRRDPFEKPEKNSYLVFNRDYSPLGSNSREWSKYGGYPLGSIVTGITSSKARKIQVNNDWGDKKIYLYHDGCHPLSSKKHMEAYLWRLAMLAKLRVEC